MSVEGALDRRTLSQVVRTLADLHGNPEALDHVTKATTSCFKWGNALGSVFKDGVIDAIHSHGRTVGPNAYKQIEASLRANKAVVVGVAFPGSRDHWFTIAGDSGKARILHAWEGCHGLRAEKGMPIGLVVRLLEELPTLHYTNNLARLREVRAALWGVDHMEPGNIKGSPFTTTSYRQIVTGTPNKVLNETNKELTRMSRALSEMSEFLTAYSGRTSHASTNRLSAISESSHTSGRISVGSSQVSEGPRIGFEPTHGASMPSRLSEASRTSRLSEASRISQFSDTSRISQLSEASRISQASRVSTDGLHAGQSGVSIRGAAGVGAGLGFVLGAGGALLGHADWSDVLEEGVKTGIGVGVAEAASTVVSKSVTPTFSKLGTSVFRANAAAGVAMFGVFALWDVAKWSKHDITAVQLRKNSASGAAGAAGGIAGGAALGAAGGMALGPPGAFIGALIGGIAGGFGGAAAGSAIDKAIWDEGEDSVMNNYEFFGWYDVKRNTRPIKPTESIVSAYLKKLEDKPSKVSKKDWATFCTANLMVLLRAMFPEFKRLLSLATDLRNANNEGIQIIGTAMYSSSLVSPESDSGLRPNPTYAKEIFDGIYFIENVETQRYLFQDGDPMKGNRGAERGWLAHSGFASPKVVGADANYYNRAYWKISHQGDGKYFIENVETKRYLFQDGEPILGNRGDEGGWLEHSGFESPKVVGADANYYNRAYWRILPQGNGNYFIENVETKRYLFQDGKQ